MRYYITLTLSNQSFNSVSSYKAYITFCKPVDVVNNDLHVGNHIYINIYAQCSNIMISDFV